MTDENLQDLKTENTSAPATLAKVKKFRWTVFAISVLCFFLPFIQVSCQQQKLFSLTGIQMAFGTEIPEPQMFGPPKVHPIFGDIFILVPLIAALIGLGSSLIKTKLGTLVPACSAAVGFLSMLISKLRLDNDILKQGGGGLNIEYLFGFIAVSFLFFFSAAFNGYLFYGERNETADLSSNDKKLLYGTVAITVVVFGVFLVSNLSSSSPSNQVATSNQNSPTGIPVTTPLATPTRASEPAIADSGLIDEFNGSSLGDAFGITYSDALDGKGAVFSRQNQSRIQYKDMLPSEGTLEWWINVTNAYHYADYKLLDNQTSALIFTTDIQGGDVTWPGSTWFFVGSDGTLSLVMATTRYDGPREILKAEGTNFRYNQWHSLGISFGNHGQFLMLDGILVASARQNTQNLGRGGTHDAAVDVPTIGEAISGYWDRHRWDGGFEGTVDRFRVSRKQEDWNLSSRAPK